MQMIPIKSITPAASVQSRLPGASAVRALFAALLMLALGACAPAPTRTAGPGEEAAQRSRESQLAADPAWAFTGRLAISEGSNGGNARIEWVQSGADSDIRISAPITGQSWRLRQHEGSASLEGLEGGPRAGTDGEALLLEATGWRIPLAALSRWVRGARADGPGAMEYGPGGLPATLVQQSWSIEFRAWDEQLLPMPGKVFASNGSARVRLVIERWTPAPRPAP